MGSIHRGRRQYIHFILFVLPALFFVLLATDIPFVLNMVYSLFEWNGISKSATFVGLQNFAKVFHDKVFWKSFLFTMRYTFFYVILVNILSLFVALQLWKNTQEKQGTTRNRFFNDITINNLKQTQYLKMQISITPIFIIFIFGI